MIAFDKPFEVNKDQYQALRMYVPGLVATRIKNGKYEASLWMGGRWARREVDIIMRANAKAE
jgi:hypothetical protein